MAGAYEFTVKVMDSHADPYYASQLKSVTGHLETAVFESLIYFPNRTMLFQHYPNPFTILSTIKYQLKDGGYITIIIFDLLGRKIRTLVDTEKESGYNNVIWDGRDGQGQPVATGLYFYEMKVGNFREKQKVVILK